MAKNETILKYKKPFHFNIGLVIFGIIIIYVIYNIFSYFTTSTISEYQVSQGMIASNNVYHGLILRDESVVYADQSGYINYYIKNASRVSVNDVVYSIDTNGVIADKINSTGANGELLSEEALQEVSTKLDGFSNTYRSSSFGDTNTFKMDLDSEISQILNSIALANLGDQISTAEANNTFHRYASGKQGVIAYYVDGYEADNLENFQVEMLESGGYVKTNLESNVQVTSNSPVYKIVNSEKWNIIFAISTDLADSLQDGSNIKIKFCKDDYSTNATYEIIWQNGEPFLALQLNTAMIRYINERFVDVELVINQTSGLKIPKSAITSKEFFTVPKSYFTEGGDSDNQGLILAETLDADTAGDESSIIYPTIYYEKNDKYYIDSELISAGTVIRKPDSILSTYTIGTDTDSLIGVYNINKGYAVFKQINIMYENDEYAIVEPKTAYGIALYDHIALDGSKLQESQLIKK